MAHTPVFRRLQQVIAAAAPAGFDSARSSVGAVRRVETGVRQTRRRFLGTAALLAGSGLVPKLSAAPRRAGSDARIAVIGAGLAGLTCAYRLLQAGFNPTVYEASTRPGGRCWTLRGAYAAGQYGEHGGELIDQGHTAIRHLAQELGLPTDNLLAAEVNGSEPLYWFNGESYSYEQATRDIKAIWQNIHRDVSEAGFPTLYNSHTERGAELDRMSISDWIEETIPGGRGTQLGRLLEVAYNIEYGAEPGDQSALNLLYLLGYSGQGQLRIFGPSNEKYRVRGGNDQIAAGLAAALGSRVVPEQFLEAVRLNADASYTLTFRSGRRSIEVVADKVVFALPFSVVREAVDLRRAGFSALKLTAIREQGMGRNSKLLMQFADRPWEAVGGNGETYADTGYQCTWDVSRAQPGREGLLVNYTGGDYAGTFGNGTPAARAVEFFGQVQPLLPGLGSAWNGRATIDFWPGNPLTRGSYSYYRVGQYTRFAGIEAAQEGNAHFCGEHTSIEFQGYLNGAVETGERAAAEILDDLS